MSTGRRPSGIVARTPPGALVIIGQPVAQSLSPLFQNAALQASHPGVHYARREVAADDLDRVLAECRAANCGGNVTMPHKFAVCERASNRTETATRTGAVNTFWWEDGALFGHNTDVDGIVATVRALCPDGVRGDVVVLGAGGAAASVLVALESARGAGAGRTIVLARAPGRATALIERVAVDARVAADAGDIAWPRVGLVINATPVGMTPGDAVPLSTEWLSANAAVFDLVYKREGTRWVQEARARGLLAEDGLRMLVEQGASAFETWFGVAAPRAEMWRALGEPMPPELSVRR